MKAGIQIKILESAVEMHQVEGLQREVWPDNETDVVPVHVLVTAAHNGGLVIGAFQRDGSAKADGSELPDQDEAIYYDFAGSAEPTEGAQLVAFVFGFPGIYETPDGLRLKHCSHMLGVRPGLRDGGIGFALKRAQWQMVRRQGIDRITWTYDPLLSRNAFLNIARLGAVCNTYLVELYGTMLDGLNAGLPSDRLQVDWWIYSKRVELHLSKQPRPQLDLAHYLSAGAQIINPSKVDARGLAQPSVGDPDGIQAILEEASPLALVEIPADFMALKAADLGLALGWRLHIRMVLQQCFQLGFVITDFVRLSGKHGRSFYVLSDGEQTL